MSAALAADEQRYPAAAQRTGAAANDEEFYSARSSAAPSGKTRTRKKPHLYLASERRDNRTVVTLNPAGQITSVKAFALRGRSNAAGDRTSGAANNTLPIWTSYDYDALKQITRVADDKGNTTKVAYDNFGRRTSIDNPDLGQTDTVYDLASNVTRKITANLRASAQAIEFDYDFNRLQGVRYPSFVGNNVVYTYGEPGAPGNAANRVTQATSEAGVEQRQYGLLGEMVSPDLDRRLRHPGREPHQPRGVHDAVPVRHLEPHLAHDLPGRGNPDLYV